MMIKRPYDINIRRILLSIANKIIDNGGNILNYKGIAKPKIQTLDDGTKILNKIYLSAIMKFDDKIKYISIDFNENPFFPAHITAHTNFDISKGIAYVNPNFYSCKDKIGATEEMLKPMPQEEIDETADYIINVLKEYTSQRGSTSDNRGNNQYLICELLEESEENNETDKQ